jgi:hypothetical protein
MATETVAITSRLIATGMVVTCLASGPTMIDTIEKVVTYLMTKIRLPLVC